jgi:hypothetical protein
VLGDGVGGRVGPPGCRHWVVVCVCVCMCVCGWVGGDTGERQIQVRGNYRWRRIQVKR